MIAINAPCGKVCPDRKILCHSTCEKYIQYKKDLEKEKQIRMREYDANTASIDGMRRMKKVDIRRRG